jgi:hypothetical protein
MKLSKMAKARIKRMNMSERKAALKAAALLADAEMITAQRYAAIHRTLNNSRQMC